MTANPQPIQATPAPRGGGKLAVERDKPATLLLFLGPAVVLLLVFLVYPVIYTLRMSVDRGLGGNFSRFVGLDNYASLLRTPSFVHSIENNVLWIIFYVTFVIILGLIIAVIAMRVSYEAIIKAIVFLPMAIAATALGVIWAFVYAYDSNIGLLNALLAAINVGPIAWLGDSSIANSALIAVGVWGSTGFATVILSAALKGIPTEIIEAARTDGANEFQIFWRIILPMVSLPISVLAVTLIVNVIKLFDIPYVMTNGGPGDSTRVIAFELYKQDLSAGQYGKAAAVAVVMLVILIPVMIFNIRRFRSEAVV
ncbi:MAG TPA: sugar ABC transporter permease [Candidatus Limnocylindrales bacterium]|nr:sugar ABC transporter permease [Candidatus Limnocylindrales bacterium]